MDYPKSDSSVGLVNGLFVDEDSITGQPGSLIPAAWANALMTELLTVVDHAGLEPDEEDNTQVLQALLEVFAAREDSIPKFATRPVTNVGPVIYVEDQMTLMHWVSTAFFTGYRSPFSGKLEFGWTPTPLPWQVEAIGNTLNETDHGGVIARFRESGLTVALGSWVAGEYKIADMGGGEWKAPDMRDMFLRFTGTDADTANATALGHQKSDSLKAHKHVVHWSEALMASGNTVVNQILDESSPGMALNTESNGSAETAPLHAYFLPFINL